MITYCTTTFPDSKEEKKIYMEKLGFIEQLDISLRPPLTRGQSRERVTGGEMRLPLRSKSSILTTSPDKGRFAKLKFEQYVNYKNPIDNHATM